MKLFKNWAARFARWMSALMPNCQTAARLQSEALDRPLSGWQRLGLKLHLLVCKWCRRYERRLHFLQGAARQCDEHEADPPTETLSPEARERMKRRLRERDK